MAAPALTERDYCAAMVAVSCKSYRCAAQVLSRAGSAEQAWKSTAVDLAKNGVSPRFAEQFVKIRNAVDPFRITDECRSLGITFTVPGDRNYPPLLEEIHDPPFGLFVLGTLESDLVDTLAVVGTRKPTPYGLKWSAVLSGALSRAGWCVVSGMALGVDCEAHEAALKNGGRTVAVLGCGLDRCYPSSKRDLFEKIQKQGAVISEFPPGTRPYPAHFPRRNRIISGMSRGCIVVEGGEKSGSLITARMALEEGRDVFAVPGRVGDRGSKGPNLLIKEGSAKLITGPEDILEDLGVPGSAAAAREIQPDALQGDERAVLEAIGEDGSNSEDITCSSGLSAAQIQRSLVILELKGFIGKTNRGLFYRKSE